MIFLDKMTLLQKNRLWRAENINKEYRSGTEGLVQLEITVRKAVTPTAMVATSNPSCRHTRPPRPDGAIHTKLSFFELATIVS